MRKYPLLMAMTFQLKMFTVVDSIEANFASPLFYSVFSIVVLLRPTLIFMFNKFNSQLPILSCIFKNSKGSEDCSVPKFLESRTLAFVFWPALWCEQGRGQFKPACRCAWLTLGRFKFPSLCSFLGEFVDVACYLELFFHTSLFQRRLSLVIVSWLIGKAFMEIFEETWIKMHLHLK